VPWGSLVLNRTRADGARGDRYEEWYTALRALPRGGERVDGGLFYDRDGSLLASLLFNAGEAYAVRANVYPGVLCGGPLGLFAGLTDDGAGAIGLEFGLPVGVAK